MKCVLVRRLLTVAAASILGVTGICASPAVAGGAHIHHEDGYPLPDAHATPGKAMRHAGPASFCHTGYTASVRSVDDSLRQRVFAEYGISYAKHGHYEVDHLIPLELGGSNGIRNLWPERGSIPNAKDGLENKLHNLVCRHRLSLPKARHAIATDWVAALHRYGHTTHVYERSPASGSGGSGGGGGHHSCTKTSGGSCIRRGEFCPQSDYGSYGYDAGGRKLECTGNRTHPHWE